MAVGKLGRRGGFGSGGALGKAGTPSWVMPYKPDFDFDFANGLYYGGDPRSYITTSNYRLVPGSGLQSTVANSDVYTLKGALLSLLSTFNCTVLVSGSGSSTVTGAAAYLLDFDNDNVNDVLYLNGTSPTTLRSFPGGSVTTPLGSGSLASTVNAIIATGGGSTSIAGNGGAVQNSARVFSAIPSPCLGGTASAGQQYNGFITRLTAWSKKLSDDKLGPLTAIPSFAFKLDGTGAFVNDGTGQPITVKVS